MSKYYRSIKSTLKFNVYSENSKQTKSTGIHSLSNKDNLKHPI